MTFNWDCATLSHCWFQIISSHSARSICCFWHCKPSDSPDHPLITGHHRDSPSLVWILSQWQIFQGGLGRGGIHRTSTGHWGELLVFPATLTLQHFTIQLVSSTITLSSWVRNLGVIFDDQLTFKDHIAKTARFAGLHCTTQSTTSYPGPCH